MWKLAAWRAPHELPARQSVHRVKITLGLGQPHSPLVEFASGIYREEQIV